MRGIPPPAVSMLVPQKRALEQLARLFQCPARGSGHWSSPRDGGYMRPGMAVPERQPSLHEKKPKNPYTIGIRKPGLF